MDVNDLRALATVLAFAAFIGIVWWAWHRNSQKGFEEAPRACPSPTTSNMTAPWGGAR